MNMLETTTARKVVRRLGLGALFIVLGITITALATRTFHAAYVVVGLALYAGLVFGTYRQLRNKSPY